MRPRRAHPDALPAGRPEVELFTFWERDVTGEPTPAVPGEDDAAAELSVAPLWCAGALALVFLLVALLL
jgi:hypothetical protein